jgi:addiction module RelB/DinJ family antitoxin
MSEEIRLRIDSQLMQEADEVCREIGITPTVAVSMFFAQMVKLRGLPFRPSEFPALEEY